MLILILFTPYCFTGNDYLTLKSQLCSGIRLPKPTFCPQRHYDFIKSCWHEDPSHRPCFTEIKDLIYKDPIFPKEFVPHDPNDNNVSAQTYEFMRKQYDSIQRSNPVYLSMAGKGDSDSNKSKDSTSTISDEQPHEEEQFLQSACDNNVIKSVEIDMDDINNCNKGLPNIATDLMIFLSEEAKTINV